MTRKGLFIILALVAVSLLVIFGVHGCQRRADRMRAVLDSALEQNRNYIPFTSDSALLEVVDYYDRYGSPNDRLRAHYALGCVYRDLHDAPIALLTWERGIAAADTTAADCDFATLFRVYGQMADIYFRQYMPEKQLEAQNQFCKYALQAGDTLNYIGGLLRRNDAYLALGDTAAVFRNIETVRQLYLERGLKAEAAQVFPSAIQIALINNKFEYADSMMQIFEQESGLFDEQGNIVTAREKYYYFKGQYFLWIGKYDSAVHQFRKLLKYDDVLIDGHRGLLSLYQHQHNSDSIYKYARLYEDALSKYLKETHTHAITLSEGMYDYSRQQQMAQAQKLRANRFKFAVIILVFLGIIVSLLVVWALQKKKVEKRQLLEIYRNALDDLTKAKNETQLLQQSLSKKETTKKLLQEKEAQILQLETVVKKLQKQIGNSTNLVLMQRMEESEIVRTFQTIAHDSYDSTDELRKRIKARPATKAEWKMMIETLQICQPNLYLMILKHHLSDLKQKVCILSFLGFDTPTMATLIGAQTGSVSNARTALAKELFNLKSAHDLDAHLREI